MRDMSNWTRPEQGQVLFPPTFDPREYLMGLVLKAASENFHSNVSSILAAAGYPHARSFDLALTKPEILPALANVLGLGESVVADMAYAARRSVPGLKTIDFMGSEVPDSDIVTRIRRISPATLRTAPFHRAVWSHGLLPFCPHSLERLIDSCPECGSSLGWFSATSRRDWEPSRNTEVNAIFRCTEITCEMDLREVETTRLSDDLVGPYRRMAALLAPRDAAIDSTEAYERLKHIEPGATFELGWQLARVFAPNRVPRLNAKSMDVDRIVETHLTADTILAGWPGRLREMLQDGVRESGIAETERRLGLLRKVASAKRSWPSVAETVRDAFPDLLERGRQSVRSLDASVVTGTVANHIVRMHTSRFATLKRSGVLSPISETGSLRAFQDFSLDTVEALARAKLGSLPGDTIGERLGISHHGVEQLIVTSVLELESNYVLLAAYPGLHVTKASFEELHHCLRSCSSPEDDLPSPIPLRIAIKAIPGEKPWSAIFQALLDGHVGFRLVESSKPLSRRIIVDASSIMALSRLRFDRRDYPDFTFSTEMTKRDAEEALNLVPGTLPTALKQELGISPDQSRIRTKDVARVAKDRISAAEICARTAVGSRRLPRCFRRARIRRRGAAGWARHEVEPLIAQSNR